MKHYTEILTLEVHLTPEKQDEQKEKDRLRCIEYMQECRDHPEKDVIWRILTSRGTDVLIYGPYPDNDLSGICQAYKSYDMLDITPLGK